MTKNKKKIAISPAEMELLKILWDFQGGTISQVLKEHTQRSGNQLAYGTMQTKLNRLVDKGVAKRVGTPGIYRAILKPDDVSGPYYETIEKFCGGSLVPLLSHLVQTRSFEKEEIELLEQIVNKYKENNE